MSSSRHSRAALVLALICFSVCGSNLTKLPDKEMEALRKIAKTLGKDWDFQVDPCSGKSNWKNPDVEYAKNYVLCNCSYNDSRVCHVTSIVLQSENLQGTLPPEMAELRYIEVIVLQSENLQGTLPPEMAELRYIEVIDLTRNYLNGTIPEEWATLPHLSNLSLQGNRFSGKVPPWIGNITTLKFLSLEANQFNGPLPPELGNLINIEKIQFSSNPLSGGLPETFARLSNLEDFRSNDNQFTGKIPEFIKNWTKLKILQLQASGFEGPIPSAIFLLSNLTELRITDINGTMTLPQKWNMTNINELTLRNCNISGEIPPLIGDFTRLRHIDLSFNKLTGMIPETFRSLINTKFIYLTSNNLSGAVPDWMFNGNHIDLSYNNFTWEGLGSSCQHGTLNLLGNAYRKNGQSQYVPCMEAISCPRYRWSLFINCGGEMVTINKSITYEADKDSSTDDASKFSSSTNWAYSSTGEFVDNENKDQYIATAPNNLSLSMPDSDLYKNARLSPLSLTYYGLCLLNGDYSVKLHFAEIVITDDETFSSLGKRIFDVSIQGKLVLKNFNIKDEANCSGKAIVKEFNATVNNNKLEIRFYWAGNGTQSIPSRGTYGPLISAISINPRFKPPSKISIGVIIGIVFSALCLVTLVFLAVLWKIGCLGGKSARKRDLRGLDLQTGSFTLRQIKAATNNFNAANKIGEGGFGSVYKGVLSDGTFIAVKQLSSGSKQGNREFVNEIGMISALQHPNLVKLYGCCIEGDQLLLVYEYMENNSLARALFGPEEYQLNLNWATRHKICIGIGRGLAYLHEESRLKIVHRDIKGTNVLLDKDFNPKISDFGLAKLDEDNTHISTRIAGTIGYMAPEYASRGYLTEKADVYSFGVVVLEIVSGKSITSYRKEDDMYLLDLAHILQEKGQLLDLVDHRLGMDFDKEEATMMINVALVCTSALPTLRPLMSAVVSMLSSHISVSKMVSDSTSPGCNPGSLNSGEQSERTDEETSQKSPLLLEGKVEQSEQISLDYSTSASDLYPLHINFGSWSNRDYRTCVGVCPETKQEAEIDNRL